MNKKSHVLIGTMFLLILFVFLGCPMDNNASGKGKDQNAQPVLVTVNDGALDFKVITEKFGKNQDVKLGNSGTTAVTAKVSGAFEIPAGRVLTVGDKVTLDLKDATSTVAGTLPAESGATINMTAGSDYHSGNGKTVFQKGSTALLDEDKFLGAGKSDYSYEWDATAQGEIELGKNKLKLVSGTLTVAKDSNIQAGYEVSVAKGATLKVATGKTLNLLATSMLNTAGKIEVAGTITFEGDIKKHIKLTGGKVIATPNSTVKVKKSTPASAVSSVVAFSEAALPVAAPETVAPVAAPAAAPEAAAPETSAPGTAVVTIVIGTDGVFTWGTSSTGGVELGNGLVLTTGTKLELAKAYEVDSADTIKVESGATLTIKTTNGVLKGNTDNATLIVIAADGVTLDKGTANFFQSNGSTTAVNTNSVAAGIYKWLASINANGGWKKQAAK
jgi:hypothetical protein